MSSLPGPPSSFSVAVHTKRRACVLDTQVALSPFGLLLAQRLSAEFDLWLARELWQILDNTQFYLAQPERLLPFVPDGQASLPLEPADGDLLRDTLRQWEAARTAHDLTGLRIYWIGDALGESLLSPGADPDLVSRFEILASSLHARARLRAREEDGVLVDCFRDAVALAATLVSYRPFILTCLTQDISGIGGGGEPLLCSYLRQWRIGCEHVDKTKTADMERDGLVSLIAKAGAGELLWTGLNLAVIHVLVPKAIVMPSVRPAGDELYAELPASDEPDVEALDWWKNARSFWYPVSPDTC
jgi:hypothetical protein